MAKGKLLRILVVILMSTFSVTMWSGVFAACGTEHTESGDTKSEITGMENMTIDNIENIQGTEPLEGPKTKLRIFVSSSMPKRLLRLYYLDATRYGAILVFKGLPNGSFKELSRLVMEIADKGETVQAQIDDEAFDRFEVNSVPTIIWWPPMSRQKFQHFEI